MKAEKSMIEVMESCEIVHKLENDEEFRQTKKAMKSMKINKMMSSKNLGRVFMDKLEDAIANEEYPLIWEIYGEIYAARMLGHLAKEQYDKLWKRVYPYITGVRLVPDGERSVST